MLMNNISHNSNYNTIIFSRIRIIIIIIITIIIIIIIIEDIVFGQEELEQITPRPIFQPATNILLVGVSSSRKSMVVVVVVVAQYK